MQSLSKRKIIKLMYFEIPDFIYDLASAFDTAEFSVLIQKLFHVGVKGKY